MRLYLWKREGFYLASPTSLTQRNMKRGIDIVRRFPRESQSHIVETAAAAQMISRPVLEGRVGNFLPNEDWKPRVEYYIGIALRKRQ